MADAAGRPAFRAVALLVSAQAQSLLKRSFDVAGVALGVLVLSPLLAIVGVLIKLGSRGPVVFRQTRVSRDGRPFEIW
jgi:lipopolysaccharide/colanic/teichoic acid biosynthesis glycosyltransferase